MSGSANMFIFFHPFLGLCCLISDYFLLRQDELIFFCFCVIGDKINEGDIDITATNGISAQPDGAWKYIAHSKRAGKEVNTSS